MQPSDVTAAMSPWEPGLLALSIYCFMVAALVCALLFLCSFLGQKKEGLVKMQPYESGIIPTGSARVLSPLPFYMIAIFFLIFDIEAAFIFSWAVSFRSLGWAGWFQMTFFIMLLLFGLVYVWKKGGLEWTAKQSGTSLKNKNFS